MYSMSLFALTKIDFRLPQLIVAVRKAAISMSSLFVNECGMLIGSSSMNELRLYLSTDRSSASRNSSFTSGECILQEIRSHLKSLGACSFRVLVHIRIFPSIA